MTSTASTTGPYDLGLLEEPGRAGCRGGVKLPHRGKWKRNEVLSSFDCSAFFNHRMGRSSMTFGFRDRSRAPMKKKQKGWGFLQQDSGARSSLPRLSCRPGRHDDTLKWAPRFSSCAIEYVQFPAIGG